MISRTIEWCSRNLFIVFTAAILLTVAGAWSLQRVPLDALPDISDVQVIIHTEWAGEPPNLIEDQVSYPIVAALLSAGASVTAVLGGASGTGGGTGCPSDGGSTGSPAPARRALGAPAGFQIRAAHARTKITNPA